MVETKRIFAAFYESANGKEPVREWLLELEKVDRKIIGEDIATVEFGWLVGMPTCRRLGEKLWEVRSSLPRNRITRVIFTIMGNQVVLLHGFIKKTAKTSNDDITLARKRLKEISI